jgi:hypothetical protein
MGENVEFKGAAHAVQSIERMSSFFMADED